MPPWPCSVVVTLVAVLTLNSSLRCFESPPSPRYAGLKLIPTAHKSPKFRHQVRGHSIFQVYKQYVICILDTGKYGDHVTSTVRFVVGRKGLAKRVLFVLSYKSRELFY